MIVSPLYTVDHRKKCFGLFEWIDQKVTTMFFYLMSIALALIIFHFLVRYGRIGMMTRNIVTAEPVLPIFGNVLLFIGLNNRKCVIVLIGFCVF